MKCKILTAAVLAVFLLVPFASPAQADADAFLDKVAGILKRVVDAGKMDAEDARKVYNAVVDKVEAVQDRIDAWKEKVADCRADDEDEESDGVRGTKTTDRKEAGEKKTRGRGDKEDFGDAKDEFKGAMRKAKADRKCTKAKARLGRYADKLKKAVDRKRCSVEKAQRKWAGVLRKVAAKLDETTLKRLKAYGEDLKAAVENGRITRLDAFKLWYEAVRKALAAE